MEFYRTHAENGDKTAAASLGFVLYLGLRGQARDPHAAARYFEMAADEVRLCNARAP